MPTRADPMSPAIHELIIRLGEEGQTAYIALTTQTLDDELQKCIIAGMKNYSSKVHDKMFEYPAPLASFAAKIDIAFAFGIIDRKMHSTLTTIRRIRNEFAHPKKPTHFRSEHILEHLKKFDGFTKAIDPYALFGNEFQQAWANLNPFVAPP